MHSILKIHPRLIGLAVATALLFGAGSGAAWAAGDYKFETAGCRSGDTVAVRLIDEATGKSVTNAQLFAVHRQWLPGKGAPRFIDRKVALSPDGEGRFTYEGTDVEPGATVRLAAEVNGSDISGSANVC